MPRDIVGAIDLHTMVKNKKVQFLKLGFFDSIIII